MPNVNFINDLEIAFLAMGFTIAQALQCRGLHLITERVAKPK
jgi:hypothetical protein